jgi:hypothetical protein
MFLSVAFEAVFSSHWLEVKKIQQITLKSYIPIDAVNMSRCRLRQIFLNSSNFNTLFVLMILTGSIRKP